MPGRGDGRRHTLASKQTVNTFPRVGDSLMAASLRGPEELAVPSLTNSQPKGPEQFTRFERARILGARALQISLGAPILTDVPAELIDPVEIAEHEFDAGVIPIAVRRVRNE